MEPLFSKYEKDYDIKPKIPIQQQFYLQHFVYATNL